MIRYLVRDVRKKKHLTQRQVEKLSGISHTTIYLIENNFVSPTLYTMLRLSKSLQVSIYDLFVEE